MRLRLTGFYNWRNRIIIPRPQRLERFRAGRWSLGASAVVRYARTGAPKTEQKAWAQGVLARRPVKVAVVKQAAKNACIARPMLISGKLCQAMPLASGGAAGTAWSQHIAMWRRACRR